MSKATFKVTGMHCSSCSMLVTMNLEEIPGVSAVDCNHASGVTVVEFDDSLTTPAALLRTVTEAGYDAEPIA